MVVVEKAGGQQAFARGVPAWGAGGSLDALALDWDDAVRLGKAGSNDYDLKGLVILTLPAMSKSCCISSE